MQYTISALFQGDFAEAERLAEQALRSGQARRWDAECSYRLTLFVLRYEQGRLDEVEDLLREAADTYRGYRSFRCFIPLLDCELGREDAARARARRARTRTTLPRCRATASGCSASRCSPRSRRACDDRDRAAVLYRLLSPYARVNALAAGEVALGPVARYLGILAATTGRRDEAAAHFEDAIAITARVGARPLLAHAQYDYARMLGDGDRRGRPARRRRRVLPRAGDGQLGRGRRQAECVMTSLP